MLAAEKGPKSLSLTGGGSRRPRLVSGVRARNHVWFFPCREACPVGRKLHYSGEDNALRLKY